MKILPTDSDKSKPNQLTLELQLVFSWGRKRYKPPRATKLSMASSWLVEAIKKPLKKETTCPENMTSEGTARGQTGTSEELFAGTRSHALTTLR